MKVAIRADASTDIGSGHVTRCLTLAHALRARGAEALFICRSLAGHHADRIVAEGFRVALLPDSEGADLGRDAELTLAALSDADFVPDWLVVDHYSLAAEWERALRTLAGRIMVIDDLADRAHDCDVLLDQNLVADFRRRYDSLTGPRTMRLLGPEYALLQARYAELRDRAKIRTGKPRRILVYFGGGDVPGLTLRTTDAILELRLPETAVDVVIGQGHRDFAALEAYAERHENLRVHAFLPSLADLMLEADLAVGASGATSWERLCLRLPAVVVTLADNQRPIASELARLGLVDWVGDEANADTQTLKSAVSKSLGPNGTEWFNASLAAVVDGLGVERVADALLAREADTLGLRPATADDVDLYFRWANEPDVRRQSFNQTAISFEDHVRWFNRKVATEGCHLFVLCEDGEPLGQIRFDVADGTAEIGYSLDKSARGRGLAKRLVALGMARMADAGVRSFRAKVKHDNTPSVAAFIRCGFTEGEAAGYRVFHRELPVRYALDQAFEPTSTSIQERGSAR